MTRASLAVDNRVQLTGQAPHPVWCVSLAFPAGALAYTTHDAALTFGGTTYSADGTLKTIVGLNERIDGKPAQITLSMSGANSTLVSRLRTDTWQRGLAVLYIGLIDPSTGALIATPDSCGSFYMAESTLTYGHGVAEASIACEPKTLDQMRLNSVTTSSADQTQRYAGDTFFHMVPIISQLTINWGGASWRMGPGWGSGAGGQTSIDIPPIPHSPMSP